MANIKKIKRFVIDVNSFITVFINKETDWLAHYLAQNKIEIFIDVLLIAELKRVLEYPKIKNFLPYDGRFYIELVHTLCTQVIAKQFHIQSPDRDDNYLYDIALTTHSKLLVTGEKALLKWVDSHVDTISLSVFKRLF
jgi:putative PIN family toxin of toxin-antitoxin system